MATFTEPSLDGETFERLWQRAERSAWRVARSCGFSMRREDREDLLQQIRLRAWKARHTFDVSQIATFERWVARVAAHACLDSIRDRYRERRLAVVEAAVREDGTTLLDDVVADVPSALDAILAEERMQELRRSIWEMPPTIRRALDLTLQGLTPQEIAERTRTEVPTVRAQLVRARSWMRRYNA